MANGVSATVAPSKSDHWRITHAGWSYRNSVDRGWVIYRDPETGFWCTASEALAVLEARGGPTKGPATKRATKSER